MDNSAEEGQSHNYGQPNIFPQGCRCLKNKLIRLNAILQGSSYAQVCQWPPRGGLDTEFPSPKTSTRDRQRLTLCHRNAKQFSPILLIDYLQQTYTHIHAHIYIYIYTSIRPQASHRLLHHRLTWRLSFESCHFYNHIESLPQISRSQCSCCMLHEIILVSALWNVFLRFEGFAGPTTTKKEF